MPDAAQEAVINAILADFSVAEELRSRAEKAKIVKRLHDWDALRAARAVDGWRNHYKRIVNVYNIGFFPIDKSAEVLVRVAGPDGSYHQGSPATRREFLDLMIAPLIRQHLVPAALQDSLLLLEDDIFAAWLLILI